MKKLNLKIKKGLSLSGDSVQLDWILIFSFLTFVFVVMALFSSMIYFSIEKDSFLDGSEEVVGNSLKVNTEQLDRVVENLNSRKEKFNTLTDGMILTEASDLVE
ncbi:MAG: hypothetical protein WC087_01685 [Candidatus Paceibacterota bacterium]